MLFSKPIKQVLFVALAAFLFTGCMRTRYITERYIKNDIEKHIQSEFSTIRTLSVFKGFTVDRSAYIELTGYKYKDNKALIIGTDKYYMARKKFAGDQTIVADTKYIELSVAQCQLIIDNYKILQQKVKMEKPGIGEEIYHDFTVANNIYISFKKTPSNSSVLKMNIWINGDKFMISTNTVIKKLEKFLKY